MWLLACLNREEMSRSWRIGYYAAAFGIGVTLALVLLSWRERSFRWLPVYAVLLLIHPAWSMGIGGDCGFGKRNLSGAISLLFILLLVRQIFRPAFPLRRFLFFLAAGSLTVWLISAFYTHIGSRFMGVPPEFLVPYLAWGYRPLLPFGLVTIFLAQAVSSAADAGVQTKILRRLGESFAATAS